MKGGECASWHTKRMNKREIRTTDLDLATYLVLQGFKPELEQQDKKVCFVFRGENIEEISKRFPESDVNKVISTYFGLKKLVRTMSNPK